MSQPVTFTDTHAASRGTGVQRDLYLWISSMLISINLFCFPPDCQDLVCEKPKVIECSAKSNNGDNWVTNTIQKYDTIKCSEDEIGCQEGREVDCSTFKVRFLCPQGKQKWRSYNHCEKTQIEISMAT